MKKKYSEVLKESLVDFGGMTKAQSTVQDIVNYRGRGELPTHKKANNVVSVLEHMYDLEDNDTQVVPERSPKSSRAPADVPAQSAMESRDAICGPRRRQDGNRAGRFRRHVATSLWQNRAASCFNG